MVKKNIKVSTLILVAILLFAAFLRLWRIREYQIFLGDEGRDALVWNDMVTKGKFTLLGPTASVGGFYLGPMYYYLALPFYYIWQDPVGPAIFVALVGIATVWLVYKVGSCWFGTSAGMISAWLYTVASLVVRYSRASWNPNPLPFFSLLCVYLAIEGLRKRNFWKLLGSGICFGIALQLHYLSLILAPVLVALFVLELVSHMTYASHSTHKSHFLARLFLASSFLLVGWAIGISPFLAFEVRHHFPNTRTVIEFLTRPKGMVFAWEPFGLFRSVTRNINRLFFTVNRWPDGSFVHAVALIATVGGAMIAIKRKQYGFLVWTFVGITVFSLYQGSISDYYYGQFFPIPFLLAGTIGGWMWEKLLFGKPAVLLILLLFTVDQSSRWPIRNQPNRLLDQTEHVADEIISLSSGQQYNFALITGGNSDHAYRYFFEKKNRAPVPLQNTITNQLLVVCEKPEPECQPLGNPTWEVAGFGRAEIAQQETVDPGFTLYRLTHYVDNQ